ncbi:MAG: thiamine phosphate synthase, partial [Sulfuritalea sp.]|nr:thiamine phosphate synthase [Sulfuritalea sp.]
LPLPVYAIGGLSPADLPEALAAGAQGIAAIRAAWS